MAISNIYILFTTPLRSSKRFLDSSLCKIIKLLLRQSPIQDNLPPSIKEVFLMGKKFLINIHFPKINFAQARYRLKFEELFFIQLRLITLKLTRINKFKEHYSKTANYSTIFIIRISFQSDLCSKKVIKEIYTDFRSGHQMNRLVQGDVGSGKTIVAFMCMLIAVGIILNVHL